MFYAIKSIFLLAIVMGLTSCATQSTHVLRQENLNADLAYTRDYALASAEQKQAVSARFQHPLTLEAVINFALENNLDAAVSAQQVALQREALTGAWWRLLPSLMLSGEFSDQNHYVPQSSMGWKNKTQSLEPSVSHDKNTRRFTAEASWNLLNLAVDFQRTQQADLQLRMEASSLDRVRQNLALDVTRAYLGCVVAKGAMNQAQDLIDRVKQRQEILAREATQRVSNPRIILSENISLLELQQTMRYYRKAYRQSWQTLAGLMGVSPDITVEFAAPSVPDAPARLDIANLPAWEREALINRPEMVRLDMKKLAAQKDVNIALVQLFPSLTPFARYNHDDNSFLNRSDWVNAGLRLSWDLLTIPRLLSERKQGIRKAELANKQRQAQALAVVVQLNLAVLEYEDARDALSLAQKLEKDNEKLYGIIEHGVRTGRGQSETMLLQINGRYLQARFNTLKAWADLMTARARLYNSLGRDVTGQNPGTPSENGAALFLPAGHGAKAQ